MGRGTDNEKVGVATSARTRGVGRQTEGERAFNKFYQSRLAVVLSRVNGLVDPNVTDGEKAIVGAWKKLYENEPYTIKGKKGKLHPTSRWQQLQIDLCRAQQMANDELRKQGLLVIDEDSDAVDGRGNKKPVEKITDPRHPLVLARKAINEAFVLSNDGFLKKEIVGRYGWGHLFEGEDDASARDLVLNEARRGMIYGMSRFDHKHAAQANPLTYTSNWASAYVRRIMQQTGRTISVKSSEADRLRLKKAVKEIESQGRSVSLAELSELLDKAPQDVLTLLPHVDGIGHLDAPVASAEEPGMTVGSMLADKADISGDLMEADMQEAISVAAESIKNPYHRAVIEMIHGLNGREKARQNNLFDGVFVDADGNEYAAKASIRKAAHRLGENGEEVVQHMDQKKLSEGLRDGTYTFVPGTPEAAELVRIMSKTDSQGNVIEPWAPTSGSVQDAQLRAESAIQKNPRMNAYRHNLRYRGDNVVENSDLALEELRTALIEVGACDRAQAAKLRTGSLSGDTETKKGSARLIGEKTGLIDAKNGRFTPKMKALLDERRAREQRNEDLLAAADDDLTEDDFAALMSS